MDGDVMYLHIPTCSAEGQGSLAMPKPELWKWRPVRSGTLISRGNGSVDVPWLQMPLRADNPTRPGATGDTSTD